MPKRALLAWEMGGGLGHIRHLMKIAVELNKAGYEPVIAQRSISTLVEEVRQAGYPMVPVPRQPNLTPRNEPFAALTYADIMAIGGYANAALLEPLLDAWDGLLTFIQPAIIIGDFCPVLPMAARGRVPFLAVGSGFVVPPRETPEFPRLRQAGKPLKAQADMLADVNELLLRRRQPTVDSLGELVTGDASLVTTWPELDIYHKHRGQPAVGPLEEYPEPRDIPLQPRLFVYLSASFKATGTVLQAAVNARIPVEAFIRDAPVQLKEALRKAGWTVHDEPPPLAERFREATVVLHHGGMGTMESALAMGCAQLLLPRHLEQSLNAHNLRARNIARVIDADEMTVIGSAVTSAMEQQRWHREVYELAQRLSKRRPFSSMGTVMETVERLALP